MKYLVIYAHPNPKSFNHAIVETISEELKKKKRDFRVRATEESQRKVIELAKPLQG